jgi:hypothetical protein
MQAEKGRAELEASEVAALVAWMRVSGDVEVLEATNLSRQGLFRAAAGLPVQAGTRSLVRAALRARRP